MRRSHITIATLTKTFIRVSAKYLSNFFRGNFLEKTPELGTPELRTPNSELGTPELRVCFCYRSLVFNDGECTPEVINFNKKNSGIYFGTGKFFFQKKKIKISIKIKLKKKKTMEVKSRVYF